MVKGVASFKRRLRDIPENVRNEVVLSMQRVAENVTREMRSWNPLTDSDIEINWTWGDAPIGSISVGQVKQNKYDKIAITIYAKGRSGGANGKGFAAMWFEFGTGERFQKTTGRRTGRITAQPFFFPVYRSNKTRIKKTISAAVRRGFKKTV